MDGRFPPRRTAARGHGLFRVLLLCSSLLVGLAGSGCEGPPDGGGGEGPGHRPQRLGLSPAQEMELGRRAAREVLSDPRKFGRVLPRDAPESRRVRAVAVRLIRASEIEPLRREMNLRSGDRFEWETNVLDKDTVNAFCLPGGKIFVFRGLLSVTQNDDQLATVMSHEMGHALAHHTSERVANDQLNHGLIGGIWAKAFDRDQEAEADHIGVFLMTFAGYDPEAAIRFWERMQRLGGAHQQLPEILSDHPSDAHRIQNLKGWVPAARAAKRAYDEGNIAPARRR